MKTTSFIKTQVETTVQGIAVVVATEYKQGETPNMYTCNVSTQVEQKWFNVNSTLNVSEQDVQVNTSGNVPVGFLAALETEMVAVHAFVAAEINAQNVES